MIDEENKSATMPETPTAPAAAPAHAAPARPATVEPEDTVFSLPLSHVTQEYPALVDDEDADTEQLDAPIGAHAAEQSAEPEATPAPAHFAEPVAEAINESAAVLQPPSLPRRYSPSPRQARRHPHPQRLPKSSSPLPRPPQLPSPPLNPRARPRRRTLRRPSRRLSSRSRTAIPPTA